MVTEIRRGEGLASHFTSTYMKAERNQNTLFSLPLEIAALTETSLAAAWYHTHHFGSMC